MVTIHADARPASSTDRVVPTLGRGDSSPIRSGIRIRLSIIERIASSHNVCPAPLRPCI
jgi:hypothetical protein